MTKHDSHGEPTLFGRVGIGFLLFVFLLGALLPAMGQSRLRELREKQKEEEQEEKAKDPNSPIMREILYQRLAKAQKAVEEEKWDEALDALEKAEKVKDLNGYEYSQIYSFYAYLYHTKGDYPNCIKSYEQVLAQDGIPPALKQSTQYTLTQLYFATEQYAKVPPIMEEWLKTANNPDWKPYIILSQAYYQIKEYRKAIQPIRTAMDIAKQKGHPIEEHWWLLLRAFYFELEDWPEVGKVLEELIKSHPKKEYWTQMASIYGQMEKYDKQLYVYEMAYLLGYLTEGRELLNLTRLFLQHENPYKAATILERGLSKGVIESEQRNWRLLSEAWSMAQESEKAVKPLIEAAKLTENGELDILLGHTYINLGQFDKAAKAALEGIRKGGLKRTDNAHILAGMAFFNQEKFDEATEAFLNAQKDPRSSKVSSQWINYIASEKQRKDELRSALQSN